MRYTIYGLLIKKKMYYRRLKRVVNLYGLNHPLVLYTSRKLDKVIVQLQNLYKESSDSFVYVEKRKKQ